MSVDPVEYFTDDFADSRLWPCRFYDRALEQFELKFHFCKVNYLLHLMSQGRDVYMQAAEAHRADPHPQGEYRQLIFNGVANYIGPADLEAAHEIEYLGCNHNGLTYSADVCLAGCGAVKFDFVSLDATQVILVGTRKPDGFCDWVERETGRPVHIGDPFSFSA